MQLSFFSGGGRLAAAGAAALLALALTCTARAQVVTYYPVSGNLILSDSGTNFYNPGLLGIDVYVASLSCLPSSGTVTQLSDWNCNDIASGGQSGYYMQWISTTYAPSDALAENNYTIAQLPTGLSALSFGYSYHYTVPPPGGTKIIGSGDTLGAVVFGTAANGTAANIVNIARSVSSENDWTGPSGGTWNTATNWTLAGGTTQRVPLSSDTATFNNPASAGTVWLSGSQTVGSLWFNSTGSYTIAPVAGGGTLVLASNAGLWVDAGMHTISAPLTMSGSLTVGAEPSLAPGSLGVTLSGPVSGSGPLFMAGPCVLSLSNTNNTYSGGTVITGGTLIAAGGGSLVASGSVSIANATLDFNTSGSFAGTVALTGAGPNTIEADAGTMSLSGLISGSGGLTKTGNGILALSNLANSYSGGTVITGGMLIAAGGGSLGPSGSVSIANATLDFSNSGAFAGTVSLTGTGSNTIQADAGTMTLSGVISGSGGLTKTGNGILALSNLANSYSGGTVITGGTLTAAGSGSLGPSGSVSIANATLDFSNSGTFALPVSLTGAGPNTIQADVGTMILSGAIGGTGGLTKTGNGVLALSNSANSYSGGTNVFAGTLQLQAATALTSTGAVSIASGAVLDLNGVSPGLANLSGSGSVTNNNSSGTSTLSAAYVGGTASYSAVILDGRGVVAVSVPAGGALTLGNSGNTYSGGTFINGGQLNLAADGDLGAVPLLPTTNLTLGGGTLYAAASFALAPNRNVSLTSNSAFDVPTGQSLTVEGAVTGTGGLTVDGGGSLILSGSNTYTGGTDVEKGRLMVTSLNGLRSRSNLSVGADAGSVFAAAAADTPTTSPIVSPVPEPGTMALLSAGTLFFTVGAWRRRTVRS